MACLIRLLQGYQRHGASSSKWMKIKHDPDFAEIVSAYHERLFLLLSAVLTFACALLLVN